MIPAIPAVSAMSKLSRCLWLIAILSVLAAPAFASTQCPGTPQCGLGCPTACYADRTSQSLSCGIQTVCLDPRPSGFSTCEDQGPAGYYPTGGRGNVSQCSLGYSGYQTNCASLATAGPTLRTCETGCPAGYTPSQVFLNSTACQEGSPASRPSAPRWGA